MQPFEDLLFLGSPFLPEVVESHVDQVLELILNQGHPPYFALAHTVAEIGIVQATIHGEMLTELENRFSCNQNELADFLSGYITPCQFLEALLIFQRHGPKQTIKILCSPVESQRGQELNRYKANMIQRVVQAHEKYSSADVTAIADEIYRICVEIPHTEDYYFMAGIEASRLTYKKLTDMTIPPPY